MTDNFTSNFDFIFNLNGKISRPNNCVEALMFPNAKKLIRMLKTSTPEEYFLNHDALNDFNFSNMQAAHLAWATNNTNYSNDAATNSLDEFQVGWDLYFIYLKKLDITKLNVNEKFQITKSLFSLLSSMHIMECTIVGRTNWRTHIDSIDPVVKQLVEPNSGTTHPRFLSDRNNHNLMKALLSAIWSRLTLQHELWQKSLDVYETYLGDLDNLSLPRVEAVRGASAAWYVNLSAMLLTTLAWMSEVKGQTIISSKVRGKSCLDLIDALQNLVVSPSILHKYSVKNMYAHPAHGSNPLAINMSFLSGYHRSRHYMCWIDLLELCNVDTLSYPQLSNGKKIDLYPRGNEFTAGFVDIFK